MSKISIQITVLLLARVPGFLFARISIDKVAFYVSAPSDPNPKNSSNLSLNATSHRDHIGPALHARHPMLLQASSRTVHRTGLNTVASNWSESLLTVARPNASSFGLTPKNASKANARINFFQAAGLVEGEACKRFGFFRGRGCALGCICNWYQYCDTSAEEEDSRFANVGMCAVRWKALLLFVLLLCSSTTCVCFFTLGNKQSSDEDEVSDEDATPRSFTRGSSSSRNSVKRFKLSLSNLKHSARDANRSRTKQMDGYY